MNIVDMNKNNNLWGIPMGFLINQTLTFYETCSFYPRPPQGPRLLSVRFIGVYTSIILKGLLNYMAIYTQTVCQCYYYFWFHGNLHTIFLPLYLRLFQIFFRQCGAVKYLTVHCLALGCWVLKYLKWLRKLTQYPITPYI